MHMCVFHYFNYYLPDFVTAICLVFTFGFSFLGICINNIECHNKPSVKSLLLAQDQALSLWVGSADSKTLDYQRTPNPKEYQTERHSQRQPLLYKTQHHLTTSSVLRRKPHPNKDQEKVQTPSSADTMTTSLSLPIRGKEQNKTQHKSHPIQSLHKPTLRRAEAKRKKEFNLEAWEKETSNII